MYWKMTCSSSAAGSNNSCYFYEKIPVIQAFVPLLVICKSLNLYPVFSFIIITSYFVLTDSCFEG